MPRAFSSMNRREAFACLLGAAAVAGAPGRARADADAVFAAFEASQAPWTLGLTSASQRSFSTPELALVQGAPPAALAGVLYRNGPGLHDRAGWRYRHWFDGDGLVHRWAIGDGRASHAAEFVNTRKFAAEEEAGRFLYSAFGSSPPNSTGIGGPDDMNAANTSVLRLGDELLALWEGGSAWVLDPETLESRGPKTWAPELAGMPFSAHPKVEPNGEVWNFALAPHAGKAVFYRIGADGTLKDAQLRDVDAPSMSHDFVVTRRHVVMIAPSLEPTQMQLPYLAGFEAAPERPMVAYAFEKDGFAPAGRWELPPGFIFHHGNAWEDDAGVIRLDAMHAPDSQFVLEGAPALMRGEDPPNAPAAMARITLRPGGAGEMERFPDAIGEFPQVDPRRVAGRWRHTWFAQETARRDVPTADALGHWDWETGDLQTFDFGPGVMAEEHVFAPRPGGADEGDGWLVGTSLDLEAQVMRLHVFDARRIADGPLCMWAAPYALPLGFHGVWAGTA